MCGLDGQIPTCASFMQLHANTPRPFVLFHLGTALKNPRLYKGGWVEFGGWFVVCVSWLVWLVVDGFDHHPTNTTNSVKSHSAADEDAEDQSANDD